MNDLYQNKVAIGGFGDKAYWSSSESDNVIYAWFLNFYNGSLGLDGKYSIGHVRAVRALEQSAAKPSMQDIIGKPIKNIIGKPIKIGNIEVAQYDFPERMNREYAKKACAYLGEGWRLPSKEELNILYQNKVAIGGFFEGDSIDNAISVYWSSTEADLNGAWVQDFDGGSQPTRTKRQNFYFRAVRSF